MLIFALLSVNQNKINHIISKIKSYGPKNLNKVHLVYGEYDVIAEIKANNPEISSNILKELKETDGVNTLKTYVVSDQLTDESSIAPLITQPW